MCKLAAVMLKAVFMVVFLIGFLVLSAVISVFTAVVKLRGWYWEKRYG